MLAIPALAVLKVFVRFFDELYLQSNLYLAPAVSASGEFEDRSSVQRAAVAATGAAKEPSRAIERVPDRSDSFQKQSK